MASLTSARLSVPIPRRSCETVDANLRRLLDDLKIQESLIPELRQAYAEHIEKHMEKKTDDRATLEAALKRINEEEERTARLFDSGRISESVWNTLWVEWNDQRAKLRTSIESAEVEKEQHIDNLQAAVNLLAKIGILYERLAQQDRKFLLKQMVKKIVINLEGMIIKVELHAPFTYLRNLALRCEEDGEQVSVEKDQSSSSGLDCSKVASLGVTTGRKDEQHFLAENIIRFTKRTTYPQRARLERLLVTG